VDEGPARQRRGRARVCVCVRPPPPAVRKNFGAQGGCNSNLKLSHEAAVGGRASKRRRGWQMLLRRGWEN